jgi:DNA (cytosine-5)-methyltransferase 1
MSTIAHEIKASRPRRRGPKPPPSPITPAEAFSDDLRNMSQDEINRKFADIERSWNAENRTRFLFGDRVTQLLGQSRMFTFVDLFCGAGGSSSGLVLAGGHLLKALNHSRRNIITHSENFRDADHECADINHYDMRNLPRGADVLWASPICTEISPAGGNGQDDQPGEEVPDELLKYGPVGKDTFERTRATAYDVIRACEVHHFPIVIVENVVEFLTRWKLAPWWLMGMAILGYDYQIVSGNSAHIEGPDGQTAPQSRDRIYIVFNRRDVAKPDVAVRPRSWCGNCQSEVRGVQTWKTNVDYTTASGKEIIVGKYGVRGGQYYFTCPDLSCAEIVHPVTRPAKSIINFHYIGEQIGGRKKPLVDNTRRRIGRGMIDHGLALVNSNHSDDRAYPVTGLFPARTVKIGDGLACPPGGPWPFLDANGGSWNTGPASIHQPFRTRTTKDWEALCTPPGAFIDNVRNHGVATSVNDPLTTVACANHHGLVVPYNRTAVPFPTTEPLTTVTTNDRHALMTGWDGASADLDALIDSSYYRMVQWYEQLLAQAFPLDYLMTGNIGERTAGAGNAVSVNVSGWLGMAAADALNRTTAAAVAPRRPRAKAKAKAGVR